MEPDREVIAQQLRDAAVEARQRAYAPYSKFRVGCALLAPSFEIFHGANLENASLGLTLCAERVALACLRMAGHDAFLKIVVASPGGVSPCGACRQVLLEFVDDAELELIDVGPPQHVERWRLSELLPIRFQGTSLGPRTEGAP